MKSLSNYEHLIFKRAKRLVIIVVGFSLLLIGIAMLVLPGPGILVILGALVVLAVEFVWARRLLKKAKKKMKEIKEKVSKNL